MYLNAIISPSGIALSEYTQNTAIGKDPSWVSRGESGESVFEAEERKSCVDSEC